MYKQKSGSFIKHLDFLLADIIVMAFTYTGTCLIYFTLRPYLLTPDRVTTFTRLGILLVVFYILSALISRTYHSILYRGKLRELQSVVLQICVTALLMTLYIFFTRQFALMSRIVFGLTALAGIILIWIVRLMWKRVVIRMMNKNASGTQLLVVCEKKKIKALLAGLEKQNPRLFQIKGLVIYDRDMTGEEIGKYAVVSSAECIRDYLLTEVVDDIYIDIDNANDLHDLVKTFLNAGIVVHISLNNITDGLPNVHMAEIGKLSAVTAASGVAEGWQLVIKRAVDIIGGLVGVFITGIMYLVVAPKIRKADPGPVFFKQKRVGKNGRVFEIYKFRSMYTDAEERKAELMDLNEMQGHMFKITNDPRIIPGIGERIRKLSIDEFPQFINVLKGDMSLVGTRPPTEDEVEDYDIHQKVRLSFKPGITGIWQTSGRSNIRSFEQIVEMDNEYINNWSLRLDFKILVKTVKVVLSRRGAK